MAKAKTQPSGIPIPDRRRTRFAANGGPKPTATERRKAKQGLAAARQVLASIAAEGPAEPTVVRRLTPEQLARARRGIAQARRSLEASDEGSPQDRLAG